MNPWRTVQTETVIINTRDWGQVESDEGKKMLLSYLVDSAEMLDLVHPSTAAAMISTPEIWFTFKLPKDTNLFLEMIEEIWKDNWLAEQK